MLSCSKKELKHNQAYNRWKNEFSEGKRLLIENNRINTPNSAVATNMMMRLFGLKPKIPPVFVNNVAFVEWN